MNEDTFMFFGLGFFLLVCFWGPTLEIRRNERADRLERERYERLLQERREFGYTRVQETVDKQPTFLAWLRK